MIVEEQLKQAVKEGISSLYGQEPDLKHIQIQPTRKDFSGDYTVVVFPFLRLSKKKPEETAQALGEYIMENQPNVAEFNVIKGFLNLTLKQSYWLDLLATTFAKTQWCKPDMEK